MGSDSACTARFENAHETVFRELLCHWHPWFGMPVAIDSRGRWSSGERTASGDFPQS